MTKRGVTAAAVLVLAVVITAATCGCGTPEAGSPAEIIEKAISAQGKLKSVRMEMDVDVELRGAPSSLQGMSNSYRGEGYFEQPDKSRMTVKSTGGTTEVITIGDKAYVKMPGSDRWMQKKVSSYLEGGTRPGDVTDYLKYTKDLQLIDHKGDTYHLKFNVDMGRYSKVVQVPGLDPTIFKGMEARMEVWILKGSFQVERAKMDFAGDLTRVGTGHVTMSMEVEFSEFNEPVTIEAPT